MYVRVGDSGVKEGTLTPSESRDGHPHVHSPSFQLRPLRDSVSSRYLGTHIFVLAVALQVDPSVTSSEVVSSLVASP